MLSFSCDVLCWLSVSLLLLSKDDCKIWVLFKQIQNFEVSNLAKVITVNITFSWCLAQHHQFNGISSTVKPMACSNASLVWLPILEPALPDRRGWLLMDWGTAFVSLPLLEPALLVRSHLGCYFKPSRGQCTWVNQCLELSSY